MLWNGLVLVVPAADTLPVFSCPVFPKLINPSLSSEFFLRPQILYATTPNPAKSAAPPIPTTTPIMVFRVLELIPDDEELPSSLRSAVAVGRVDVTVEEARELNVDPDWVKTAVLTTTNVVGVGVTLAVVFVDDSFSDDVEVSSVDDVVLVGVDEADVDGVAEGEVVGVFEGLVVVVVTGGALVEAEEDDGVGVGVASSSDDDDVVVVGVLPDPVPVA